MRLPYSFYHKVHQVHKDFAKQSMFIVAFVT
jgi:hypothetical protein